MTTLESACAAHHHAQEHQVCVSLVPIFNHLPHDQLVDIARMAKTRTFEKGEFIHRPGDQTNQLHIVHTGRIRIYRLSGSGKEQLLRILKPGSFTGELAIFSDARHATFAQAMERSDICALHRDDVQKLLVQHPSISLNLLSELARRLDQSEEQSKVIATESVDIRIAEYLSHLAEDAQSDEVLLPMTRKDLASYLGTTPETISRRLVEFENAGMIRQVGQRGIHIANLERILQP
ncbi:Crp/Fnr family transcriptional regulator [Allopusillimonas ginsengisoli]|uniref:Crp/Fnr family transcriptional regulator n=1 Tax=Allopusillimonas ginsengisoli TaxID=453575 RepID=UPI0010C16AC3|nr:Crp/Fnr family transcriptional regulator [Allopusillimonas ginsengisoli]